MDGGLQAREVRLPGLALVPTIAGVVLAKLTLPGENAGRDAESIPSADNENQ